METCPKDDHLARCKTIEKLYKQLDKIKKPKKSRFDYIYLEPYKFNTLQPYNRFVSRSFTKKLTIKPDWIKLIEDRLLF